ncbi:AraC family transcriptional regulator [Anaerobacillus sp. 1_MG-2023]|uniref:helix-turn-helix domain-containing protein n=1 Tax=Bacillales TaxID=1385 RepID=UPI0026E1CF4E|nr:AraC family transcriptional regulator [Anaerobacillus sp. 1_MG-2023]MDO6656832.1 AraC family transcriptional regulator [Anaerobacillus sp. 1_MG-2023]
MQLILDARTLQNYVPSVIYLAHWKEKHRFVFEEDVHPKWVLFAVEKGEFEFSIGDKNGVAQVGDLVFCPPNTPFKRKLIEPLSFFAFIFEWELKKEYLSDPSLLKPLEEDESIISGKWTLRDFKRLSSNFEYLALYSNHTHSQNMSRINYILRDMWNVFCWELEEKHVKQIGQKDKLMIDAKNAIQEKGLMSLFSMNDLSVQLGLSPVQLTRRFKAAFRMTPKEYLISLRVEEAKKLLANTDWTMDEIARHSGYENRYYFSRAFRTKEGKSPSEFKKIHQM